MGTAFLRSGPFWTRLVSEKMSCFIFFFNDLLSHFVDHALDEVGADAELETPTRLEIDMLIPQYTALCTASGMGQPFVPSFVSSFPDQAVLWRLLLEVWPSRWALLQKHVRDQRPCSGESQPLWSSHRWRSAWTGNRLCSFCKGKASGRRQRSSHIGRYFIKMLSAYCRVLWHSWGDACRPTVDLAPQARSRRWNAVAPRGRGEASESLGCVSIPVRRADTGQVSMT